MLYGLANHILSSDTVIDKTFMCKTQNLIRRDQKKKKKEIKMTLLSSFLFQFIAKDRPYMEFNKTFRVHQVIGKPVPKYVKYPRGICLYIACIM